MRIFIDESGDTGFKIPKGSTTVFAIALVIFEDDLDAEETALKIKKYRRLLNKRDTYEFKFSKSSKELRISFLNEVKNCRFKVRAIVFTKESIYSNNLRKSKEKFYSYALKSLLEHNNNTIEDACVYVDGLGEREFRKSLTRYLKTYLNSGGKNILKRLKFRDSNKDVLIQLADMVVGAIRKSYDDSVNDSKCYREIIKKRLVDVWDFK